MTKDKKFLEREVRKQILHGIKFKNIPGYEIIEEVDINDIDTSNVESFESMFKDCFNLMTIKCEDIDTSKAKSFRDMFYDCDSLKSIPVDNWDVSNGENFIGMFCDCDFLEN